MTEKDYNEVVKYMEEHCEKEQEKGFRKQFSYLGLPHFEYITEEEYVRSKSYHKIKFRICSKTEIKVEFPILYKNKIRGEGINGLYCYAHNLIWIKHPSPNVEKIMCLIHESCHMVDYYDNSELYKKKDKEEREYAAILMTIEFINNKIQKDFSKEIFKEINDRHEKWMKKMSQGHFKNVHAIACRRIFKERK